MHRVYYLVITYREFKTLCPFRDNTCKGLRSCTLGVTQSINMRVLFSFEKWLGKERFDDFMNARHIGCVVQSLTLNLMGPVRFPDSVSRLTQLHLDPWLMT